MDITGITMGIIDLQNLYLKVATDSKKNIIFETKLKCLIEAVKIGQAKLLIKMENKA